MARWLVKTKEPSTKVNSYVVNWRSLGVMWEHYTEDYREAVELFNKLDHGTNREVWGWQKNNGVSERLIWEERGDI